jgi:Protein of unknown function (DUF4232)
MKRSTLTHVRSISVAGLAAALLLSGCSGDDKDKNAGAWGDGQPSAAASTESGAVAADGGTTVGDGDAEAAADPKRCRSGDLDVTVGTVGNGGDTEEGVTQRVNLVFTNKSGKECTLNGYPKVAWVADAQGIQVNESFERDPDVTRAKVALAPGKPGHAVLLLHATSDYDDASCKPLKISGLRVQAPAESTAVFVSNPQTVCSISGVNLAQVQPIAAGAGA